MMSFGSLRNSLEWALMVALVFGAGAIAQAQHEEEGRVVQIGPSTDGAEVATEETEVGAAESPPVEQPKHWIGLLGGPVTPELRAHVLVPEDQGLMVRQVVPESPAAKAGLKDFDILLRANETELREMRDLVEIVKTAGDASEQITLEVLRAGKRETVYITPAARPEKIANLPTLESPTGIPAFGGNLQGVPEDVLKFFEHRGAREGGPFAFRSFGPGMMVPQHGGVGNIPSGVSVSIQKQGDGPAHITVKRGEETWTVSGDDLGSLEQLPADVRPFVEQLLQGGGSIGMPLPELQNYNITVPGSGPHGMLSDPGILDRLDSMERHLRKLEERLESTPAENE
jgi:membrane-associated protease RseP (regulator of RpoE activity)